MANSKIYPERQSPCIKSEAANIAKEPMFKCSNEIYEVLGYSGQQDPDPAQIECFLINPKEPQKDTRLKSSKKLSCQICKASFDGSTSRQELLEHVNSVHSFAVCQENSEGSENGLPTVEDGGNSLGENEIERKNVDAVESGQKKTEKRTEEVDRTVFSIVEDVSIIKKKTPNDSFKCYICSTGFNGTSDFESHLISAHGNEIDEKGFEELFYRCKKCAAAFPNFILLREHFMKKHATMVIYRCVICHVTLKTKKLLKIHHNNFHARKSKELHSCDECGKELTNLKALKAHIRLKHGQNNYKHGFRCRLCQQKFDSMESRKLHYDEEHLGECPFTCNDCGKGFSSKSGLYGHRQLHKTEQVSTCPYCEKIFNRKDSYHEHILIHVGPKHRCPHCPKEFVQRSNLVRHIRIHTGQKPYTCTYCDKRFSDKGACNSHIRVHTKEEQCACPYCGQTFTKKQKLKYHIRKHTGEGLMSCEICSKTFTNSFALKEHRAIHNRQTQTICVECGKAFNSAKYLQRHIALVHQESRDSSSSLNCPICGKSFCHQARLKSHLVTHLGKKHLQCLICEKRYSSVKSVRNHLQQSHEITRQNQTELKKYVRSAFETTQLSFTPIESPIVSPSGNEEKPTDIFMNGEPGSGQLQSNHCAIINDGIKVKTERSIYQIQHNSSMEFLQLEPKSVDCFPVIEEGTRLNPDYLNSEISRRRKQLRTPKKYVSSVENCETIENNLINVMPKRDRVEAIARSLKEATNLKRISVDEEAGEEVDDDKEKEKEKEKENDTK